MTAEAGACSEQRAACRLCERGVEGIGCVWPAHGTGELMSEKPRETPGGRYESK